MSPHEQARVALRVLAGQLPAEQAAREHGVTVDEIASWCSLLRAGASAAAARRGRRLKTAALVAVGLLGVGATVSIAATCPETSPVLNVSLVKFCPDTPASGYDLSQNFSLVASWVAKKTGAPIDQPVPPGSVKNNQINDGQITTANLAIPAVTDAKQLGTLGSADLADNTLVNADFDPAALVKIYKHNPNCEGRDATTTTYSLSATCFPQECGVPCSTPTGPGMAVADCAKGCTTPVCHPATCDVGKPTLCVATAPFSTCDNTPAGFLLAP